MIISRGRGYVFVHIPKTGGTAMALALEGRAKKDDILIGDTPKAKQRKHRLAELAPKGRLWKHSTIADIDGILSAEELDAMFCFTLVRNPWDRMVSYYHWLRAQKFEHPAVALAQASEFEAFVRHPETVRTMHASPNRHYMTDARGIERCDSYVRLEHLGQDLRDLEAHLGFEVKLGRINVSKRAQDYRQYYSESLAEFVHELCRMDVERFKYAF
jgi:hypothetical protein